MAPIRITPRLSIDDGEITESFIQASGPGGQNVNKVATAVELRFDVARSPSLPEGVRQRLIALAGRRLTQDGILVLFARKHRTQERNRADARERLIELIRDAATPPILRRPTVDFRHIRPTRPTLASKQRRLESKGQRSVVKKARGKPVLD